MFRELREHLRYRLDRVFARESLAQFFLLVVLVVVMTLFGMTAVFWGLFSPENEDVAGIPREIDSGFFDSLWWSLQQVLYIRQFEKSYGATIPIVLYSLFLSIAGLGVFGILVGLINTAIERRIESLRKGDSPVKERGHLLILGWNNKVFSILRMLWRVQPGSKIVILASRSVAEMEESLRAEELYRQIRPILRTGVQNNRRELERVAFDRAASIIVLSQDDRSGSETDGDSEVIKTMMLLSSCDGWRSRRPRLTAEIAQQHNHEVATIAGKGTIPIVSRSNVISKVIVQSIRHPGLSRIYSEVFSPDGNAIHLGRFPECVERTMREVAYGFHSAVPVGVAWSEKGSGGVRHAAGLNPEPDYEIDEDEQLILLSRDERIAYVSRADGFTSSASVEPRSRGEAARRVLLVGWNGNIYDILSELDAHAGAGTSVVILSSLEPEEAQALLTRFGATRFRNIEVECRRGDAIHRNAFAGIEIDRLDSIVLLADGSSGEKDVDARTIRTLLLLTDLCRGGPDTAHLVVELLDGTDRELLDGLAVDDVIISPAIVSAQIAQISRQPILGAIYRELLSAGGMEIGLRPAGEYVRLDRPCTFDDLTFAAHQRLETALGIRVDGEIVEINPSRDRSWQLTERDHVIVLAQEIYR